MANTVERHASWGSERRSERGGAGRDSRRNPRFNIDRAIPNPAHSYAAAHPKPTFMQQLLGVGPQAKDFSRARSQYNKSVYVPAKRELKHDRIAHRREWERTKEKEARELFRRVHQLQDQVERESNPHRLERLQGELKREQERADQKFERFVETTERSTEQRWRAEDKQLHRDREEALRAAREELNKGLRDSNDETPAAPLNERFA